MKRGKGDTVDTTNKIYGAEILLKELIITQLVKKFPALQPKGSSQCS